MNDAMKELVDRAKVVMAKEKTFESKESALTEALRQCRNLDGEISVWKAPNDMGGKYTIVHDDNLEDAVLCGYDEVFDRGKLFDMVKENIDHIEEV